MAPPTDLSHPSSSAYQFGNSLRIIFTDKCEPVSIKDIDRRIRERQLEWGMTRVELAEHLEVGKTAISMWVRGLKTPSFENLLKISAWLAEGLPEDAPGKWDTVEMVWRMRERRLECGWSQCELAEYLHITPNAVYKLETCQSQALLTTRKLIVAWLAEDLPEGAPGKWDPTDPTWRLHIGRRIRNRRLEWGWSQRELAKYLEIAVSTVVRWERGILAPSHETITQVAAWLAEDLPEDAPGRWDAAEMARRVRERRLEWGWSQRQLAKHLGVDPSTIHKLEVCRYMASLPIRRLIAAWLAEDLPEDAPGTWDAAENALRVKERRLEWGMTQIELAEYLDLGSATINALERCRVKITFPIRKRIVAWLVEDLPANAPGKWDAAEMSQRMRKCRMERKMTLPELAKRLCCSVSTVHSLLWGRSLASPKMRKKIVAWLAEETPGQELARPTGESVP